MQYKYNNKNNSPKNSTSKKFANIYNELNEIKGGRAGGRASEVQKKYSHEGKLNEKKFMHAN